MRSKSPFIGCLLFLGLLVIVAGCKSETPSAGNEMPVNEGTPETEVNDDSATKVSGDEEIDIIGGAFVPGSVTVSAGSTITWTNKDAEDHSVSFNEETILDSVVDPGETVDATFDAPGTYKYKDKFTGAKGEVVVE